MKQIRNFFNRIKRLITRPIRSADIDSYLYVHNEFQATYLVSCRGMELGTIQIDYLAQMYEFVTGLPYTGISLTFCKGRVRSDLLMYEEIRIIRRVKKHIARQLSLNGTEIYHKNWK